MIRDLRLLFLAAAVAFTAACKMDPEAAEPAGADAVTVSFEAESPLSRASFTAPDGDSYPVVWQDGDAVKILGAHTGAPDDVVAVTPSGDGRTASFSVDLKVPQDMESVNLDFLCPSSAFAGQGEESASFLVRIPATQVSSALSADPSAMLLSAYAGPFGGVPEGPVKLSFQHLTAYGRIELQHVEGVRSVSLVSDRDLAGTFLVPRHGGTLSVAEAVRRLDITLAENADAVWFACAPGDWSGSTLEVTATTDRGTCTRTVTFPEGRQMRAGQIACFSVDMYETPGKTDVFDETAIVFSFGAISDTHVSGTTNDSGKKLTSALRQLKAKALEKDEDGLDAVVVAGDLTDTPGSASTQTGYFKRLYEAELDPVKVPMIYTIGNHDANSGYRWSSNTVESARVMSQALGSKYFLTDLDSQMRENFECRDCLVDGYHVLCVTPNSSCPVGYYGNVVLWLDQKLKELTEADPERYVFVNTHPMIENTVYGSLLGAPSGVAISEIWYSSAGDYWATRALSETLAKYPQAVTFGGHLHFPLHDPRSIWQGAFTSFGCGSVYYMAIENGKYENMNSATVMNDSYEVSDGWLIQLDRNGNLRATAMDFSNQAPIGTPYEIPYPREDKSHLAHYGAGRSAANQAPVLDPDRLMMTTRQVGSLTSTVVGWAKGSDDEFVHHYVLTVSKDGATIAGKKYLSDFYRHPHPSGMKDSWTVSLGSLPAGTYQVTLEAFDSWDASSSLTKSFTVEGPQPVQKGLFADLDFEGGTVRDSKGNLIVTNKGATFAETAVTHAGKNYTVPAMRSGADKYVQCQFDGILSSAEMASFVSEGFSIEVMFLDRAPGAGINPVHGVFCGTQRGGWGLALTSDRTPYFIVGENSENNYVRLDAASAVSASELTHVVCAYDPAAKNMTVYVNGSVSASQSVSGRFFPGVGDSFNRFCLGADISLTDTPDYPCTDMIITDAKWYVGALDAAAVQTAYSAAVQALNP